MRCGGYSLIEVLVAMFILAVGVLGAAATQAVALRMRHDSDLMTAAVRLGATLGERLRANPSSTDAYLFEFDAVAGARPAAPTMQCFAGANCSAAQLAAFDIHDISHTLSSSFPGGRIRVCRDAQPWDAARHSLRWQCADGAGAPLVVKIGWRERTAVPDGPRLAHEGPRVALPLPEEGP